MFPPNLVPYANAQSAHPGHQIILNRMDPYTDPLRNTANDSFNLNA